MRRQPIAIFPLLLAVLLPWLAAAAVAGQSDGATGPGQTDPGQTDPGQTDPGQTDPGQTGPGKAAPWSVEGTPTPPQRPRTGYRDRDRQDLRFKTERREDKQQLRCEILEVEELGRIYVQELSGINPFWIQLPEQVKIRTYYPEDFGGRKKLTLDDLEAGQRLVVTLRRSDDEIVKVTVRPAKV